MLSELAAAAFRAWSARVVAGIGICACTPAHAGAAVPDSTSGPAHVVLRRPDTAFDPEPPAVARETVHSEAKHGVVDGGALLRPVPAARAVACAVGDVVDCG